MEINAIVNTELTMMECQLYFDNCRYVNCLVLGTCVHPVYKWSHSNGEWLTVEWPG